MRAVFLDKDGTLIENIPYNIDPRQFKLLPGVNEGLQALYRAGYGLIVVSNQSGVGRGLFSEADLLPGWIWLSDQFYKSGAKLLDILYCPHFPDSRLAEYSLDCPCRKPKPGMLFQAAKMHEIELDKSWMIGDILDDVEAGHSAGCRSILVDTGGETEWRTGSGRKPDYVARRFLEAVGFILGEAKKASFKQRFFIGEKAGHDGYGY